MREPHALDSIEITLSKTRVLLLAGSDLDYPMPCYGGAVHRLIISEDAVVFPWQAENLVGWEIRRIQVEPFCRFLVSDDSVHYTILNEAYECVDFRFGDKTAADFLAKYFEKLWSNSQPYDYVPSKTVVERHSVTVKDLRWREAIRQFAKKPLDIRNLTPRHFEEFIAQLLICEGFEVTLTGRGKDGGRDILAASHGSAGKSLTIVECKRYAPGRKIDVKIVRALYGVLEAERVTRGIIATTSSFTLPAYRFQRTLDNRIVLRGYGEIAKWVRRINELIA